MADRGAGRAARAAARSPCGGALLPDLGTPSWEPPPRDDAAVAGTRSSPRSFPTLGGSTRSCGVPVPRSARARLTRARRGRGGGPRRVARAAGPGRPALEHARARSAWPPPRWRRSRTRAGGRWWTSPGLRESRLGADAVADRRSRSSILSPSRTPRRSRTGGAGSGALGVRPVMLARARTASGYSRVSRPARRRHQALAGRTVQRASSGAAASWRSGSPTPAAPQPPVREQLERRGELAPIDGEGTPCAAGGGVRRRHDDAAARQAPEPVGQDGGCDPGQRLAQLAEPAGPARRASTSNRLHRRRPGRGRRQRAGRAGFGRGVEGGAGAAGGGASPSLVGEGLARCAGR